VVLERTESANTNRPKAKATGHQALDDIVKAVDVILHAVANHKCTAADGQALCAMLRGFQDLLLAQKLPRLEELETLVKKPGGSD
jgi:hypothetical protein